MLCAGPGLQSSSCRVMLYHTRSTEDGNAYSLQRVLGAASRWPSAWAGKRCFRTRSQHPAESFARLHNPPCMALPCCPPFAQGGLSLCPGALSGPFLNRFARTALWLLPAEPEHRGSQRIKPSASFGRPATGPLPRWVIEPGIKQKIPPGWEVFFVVCFARIALWLLPAEPEHRGSQRIKPGRIWPWRHATTKFGPPGR